MKKTSIKKLLATTLAVSMIMASALTVFATGGSGGSGGSGGDDSSSESEPVQTYADQYSESAGAAVSIAGSSVKTSLGGVYAANSVQGVAVTTPLSDVKAALGLSANQTPVVIIYDTDTTKSYKAMASINAAVEAIGGTYVTSLNIDLGAKQDGKWVTLTDGNVALVTGLPKTADTTKIYSIVCIQTGGVTTIFDDEDTDPKTVTFPVQAGLGTYALVAK